MNTYKTTSVITLPALWLAFSLGELSFHLLPQIPSGLWLFILIIFAVLLAAYFHQKRFLILLMALGFIYPWALSLQRVSQVLPELCFATPQRVEGVVASMPVVQDGKTTFLFESHQGACQGRFRVILSQHKKIEPGDTWQFWLQLKPIHGLMNPHGVDEEKMAWIANINAKARALPKEAKHIQTAHFPYYFFERLRNHIAQTLKNLLKDDPNVGVIEALLIGSSHDLTEEDRQVFSATGTAHLLAVSGLHVGLVAGGIFIVLRRMSQWLFKKESFGFCASSALGAGLFYSGLSGMGAPAVRALIMFSIVMFSEWRGRKISLFTRLCAALGSVLILQPFAPLSLGFWLSFSTVSLIVLCLTGQSIRIKPIIGLPLGLGLGTAPMTLFFFRNVSIVAPVANFILIPLYSFFVVPLVLLGGIFLWNNTFSFIFFKTATLGILLGSVLMQWLAALNHTLSLPLYISPITLFCITIGTFIVLLPKGLIPRLIGVLGFLPVVFLSAARPSLGHATITLFDIGQGLAALIETEHHVLLFDTGPKPGKTSTASRVIVPFIEAEQWRSLDMMMVSHGDMDHRGGVPDILENFHVRTLMTAHPDFFEGVPVTLCEAGQHWQWDEVNFEVFNPPIDDRHRSRNNESCVLKVTARSGKSILFPADIEKSTEKDLSARFGAQLKSTILVAAHHGSKTSSSEIFLETVAPESILIPVGFRNQYHMPHAEVLGRYQQHHIPFLSTAIEGALTVELRDTVEITAYRKQYPHYWYR